MKTVFVGPTFPDASKLAGNKIDIRPPASQGDVFRAAKDGATVIGIVDGYFEYAAPIWHKEILFALSQGLRVFGAASMGALRAAECAAYGMTGIGWIYEMYASGQLEDDSAVAQLHAPGELGYRSLSEPLVNVVSTLGDMLARGLIGHEEQRILDENARAIFFKQRTWKSILAAAQIEATRAEELARLIAANAIDQKRRDAEELLAAVIAAPDTYTAPPENWRFNKTTLWDALERNA